MLFDARTVIPCRNSPNNPILVGAVAFLAFRRCLASEEIHVFVVLATKLLHCLQCQVAERSRLLLVW